MAKKLDLQQYIAKLREFGWFSSVDEAAYIKEMYSSWEDNQASNMQYWWSLPFLSIDAELELSESSYEEIIQNIAKGSFGQFSPESVSETTLETDKDNEVIKVVVTAPTGKSISATFHCVNGYIDMEFPKFLKKAVALCNPDSDIYLKDTGNPEYCILIGPKDGIAKAKKSRMFSR